MTGYFGFMPSTELSNDINHARDSAAKGDTVLYPIRDRVAKAINDELVESTLVQVVIDLPPNYKKDTMLKLANCRESVGLIIAETSNQHPDWRALKFRAYKTSPQHSSL